ncbi:MAG: hypothetical protein V1900_01820 [Candidatus Aenigmatarchaeota archaeon]
MNKAIIVVIAAVAIAAIALFMSAGTPVTNDEENLLYSQMEVAINEQLAGIAIDEDFSAMENDIASDESLFLYE